MEDMESIVSEANMKPKTLQFKIKIYAKLFSNRFRRTQNNT